MVCNTVCNMYNILLGKGRVVSFKDRSMQKRGGHNKARSVNIEHVGTYYILHGKGL